MNRVSVEKLKLQFAYLLRVNSIYQKLFLYFAHYALNGGLSRLQTPSGPGFDPRSSDTPRAPIRPKGQSCFAPHPVDLLAWRGSGSNREWP